MNKLPRTPEEFTLYKLEHGDIASTLPRTAVYMSYEVVVWVKHLIDNMPDVLTVRTLDLASGYFVYVQGEFIGKHVATSKSNDDRRYVYQKLQEIWKEQNCD